MTACVGALLIDDGRVLLGRRAGHKSYADCWDIVGGHVEPDESLDAALARELVEEIGVTPLVWRLMNTFRFREGDTWSDLSIYRVDDWAGEPRIANDEHVDLAWFAVSEAGELENLAAEEYRDLFRGLSGGG